MTTIATPIDRAETDPASRSLDYETQLAAIVANALNVALEAQKLEAEDAKDESRPVSVNELKSGSRAEIHWRAFLKQLSAIARRILINLVHFGHEGDEARLCCSEVKEHLEYDGCDEDRVLIDLLEGRSAVARDLRCGWDRARLRGALRKLAARLDETGKALGAILDEERDEAEHTLSSEYDWEPEA